MTLRQVANRIRRLEHQNLEVTSRNGELQTRWVDGPPAPAAEPFIRELVEANDLVWDHTRLYSSPVVLAAIVAAHESGTLAQLKGDLEPATTCRTRSPGTSTHGRRSSDGTSSTSPAPGAPSTTSTTSTTHSSTGSLQRPPTGRNAPRRR
jgi:hypothetical protein